MPLTRGGLAQLGERLNGIQEVRGSNPLSSTKPKALVENALRRILQGLFSWAEIGQGNAGGSGFCLNREKAGTNYNFFRQCVNPESAFFLPIDPTFCPTPTSRPVRDFTTLRIRIVLHNKSFCTTAPVAPPQSSVNFFERFPAPAGTNIQTMHGGPRAPED